MFLLLKLNYFLITIYEEEVYSSTIAPTETLESKGVLMAVKKHLNEGSADAWLGVNQNSVIISLPPGAALSVFGEIGPDRKWLTPSEVEHTGKIDDLKKDSKVVFIPRRGIFSDIPSYYAVVSNFPQNVIDDLIEKITEFTIEGKKVSSLDISASRVVEALSLKQLFPGQEDSQEDPPVNNRLVLKIVDWDKSVDHQETRYYVNPFNTN